jgi:hypothetical protein
MTVVGALIGGLAALPLGPVAMMIGATGGALIGGRPFSSKNVTKLSLFKGPRDSWLPARRVVTAEIGKYDLTEFQEPMGRIGDTALRT